MPSTLCVIALRIFLPGCIFKFAIPQFAIYITVSFHCCSIDFFPFSIIVSIMWQLGAGHVKKLSFAMLIWLIATLKLARTVQLLMTRSPLLLPAWHRRWSSYRDTDGNFLCRQKGQMSFLPVPSPYLYMSTCIIARSNGLNSITMWRLTVD